MERAHGLLAVVPRARCSPTRMSPEAHSDGLTVIGLARWLCLAVLSAGWEARQRPLFHVAAAWARLALSRRIAYFHLPWDLGCKFELSVFGGVLLSHGRLPLS